MDRLTFVDEEGRILFTPNGCDKDAGYTIIQLAEGGHIDLLEEIAERLANDEQRMKEYEDIGLTPKQLMEVDKLYAEKCKELAELQERSFSGLELVKIWAKLKKIKEYQELEEQGKLLKLPCAVGDWVYKIKDGWVNYHKVDRIEVVGDKANNVYFKSGFEPEKTPFCTLDDFGKTVFLTEEEAEAALKEL